MKPVIDLANKAQDLLDLTRAVDFLGPLLLRLYLVPVFWVAGTNKLSSMDDVIAWFGNPDWGLGLPFPTLMAWLATLTEAGGAILLLFGLATRWISIPLIVTMVVAAASVHWHNGWQAVADAQSPFPPADIGEAMERLERARGILQEHGNYEWLTQSGSFVISNNGIEWAATYFVMLVALLFLGGGRFFSLDYWISRQFRSR
ncbi:MAG: DoxX family protein [Chromatiales bacterium]|jgi:uncharacterized membrane protein YphA (DoxX/SURF4 family)